MVETHNMCVSNLKDAQPVRLQSQKRTTCASDVVIRHRTPDIRHFFLNKYQMTQFQNKN